MKKTLLFFSSISAVLMGLLPMHAQNLQTMPVQTGFNADVVANGIGSSALSTSADVDGVNYNFVARDFQLTSTSAALTYGLPTNGLITSAVASPAGLTYQLASYSANNALRLQNTNDSGTLVFTTPLAAVNLYMLATSGSGASTVNVTVNYVDTTTETFTNLALSDWYGGTNFAITALGRINRTNDVLETGGGNNPRLYQIPIAISAANQSKLIQSVTITKTGTGGIPNIMAFSVDAYTSCSGPTNITYVSSNDGGTLSWTAPASAPSSGYDYYYSTSATPPNDTTIPSGSVAAGVTSVTLTGLPLGTTYYFWVRSNCGSTQGFWQMKVFTTGQIVVTYTNGDINTEYSTGPTLTSTTACPGTLTVNVPAGYYIASTDVAYTMTTASNGWMSEQRSLLVCTTNNTTEAAITSGVGGTTGTYTYNRTGLGLANNLTGAVNFELRAWRTYGGSACNADYNRVDNNSWKVTVTLTQNMGINEAASTKVNIYPVPFTSVLHLTNATEIQSVTFADTTGKIIRTVDKPQDSIHLTDLQSGLYLVTLQMIDGSVQYTKVIKE
ncbi:T9SS type A sorting domain-containing protein [Flavobacterium stagni]|uniref:T9SS type A sorting domain-containing protein n=1 Tax=Flavobacterium stagni TaxID=2506421 RepID=A0A4Q1KBL2_9FLAO|nr:T9SS type A sorting domain-containing protein [Flavobacterium stagni]RXR24076.1 T9SS type A sorting domain-containing protein [Flavobacterium stagni]